MKTVLHALLLLLVITSAPLASAAATRPAAFETEYVLLSGGPSLLLWEKWKNPPHDKWWMNFIRAAEIRINELKSQGVPASRITWMVYRPAYLSRAKQENLDLIGYIENLHTTLGVKLKFFSRAGEVVNYINEGKPRDRVQIADLEYFGHSNKACWMFDYSNLVDSSSKVWIHEKELTGLQPGIFTKDAFIKSWGCHTGESMSQKFRKITGVKMWGATGRSQYNTHELPTLALPEKCKWTY